MTNKEAVNWLINLTADIGKAENSTLWHYEQALSEIREMIESEPERKKGKWISYNRGLFIGSKCSQCDWLVEFQSNFCPNCGADMRGEPNA